MSQAIRRTSNPDYSGDINLPVCRGEPTKLFTPIRAEIGKFTTGEEVKEKRKLSSPLEGCHALCPLSLYVNKYIIFHIALTPPCQLVSELGYICLAFLAWKALFRTGNSDIPSPIVQEATSAWVSVV